MGYYTRHTLTVLDENNQEVPNDDFIQEIGDTYYEYFDDESKWYDCIAEMTQYSKKHPNHSFIVYGEGEENDDIWQAKFKNGKSVEIRPEMVWPDWPELK